MSVKNSRKRVAVVTNLPFWLGTRGSHQRIDTLVRHLNKHFPLTVWQLGKQTIRQWLATWRELPFRVEGPSAPAGWLASAFRGLPGLGNATIASAFQKFGAHFDSNEARTLGSFRSDAIGAHFNKFIRRTQPDVILIQYIMHAYLCEFIPDSIRQQSLIIMDTHDLMSMRKKAFENVGLKHWLEIDAIEEAAALAKVDVIIAIQEREAAMLRDMLPDRKVILAKHAMQPVSLQASQHAPSCIGFFGSSGEANRFGAEQFIQHCWAEIRTALGPSVQLRIGGTVCETINLQQALSSSEIELVGRVADPADFYQAVDIVINPVRIESGFKTKSLEALAHGKPLVSFPAGIVGMEAAIGKCVLVASSWNEFRDHVIRLGQEPRLCRAYAREAIAFVSDQFSPTTVFAELVEVIGHANP